MNQTFTKLEELPELNIAVHDRWFDVTRISEDGSDLVIPFASRYESRAADAVFDSVLRVSEVRSWSLLDTEQVAIYDFCDLSFDPVRQRLTIEGGVPVTIHIDVTRLSVTVERDSA